MRKQWIRLSVLALAVAALFSHARVSAAQDFDSFINAFSADANTYGVTSVQNIIFDFCSFVISSDPFVQGDFVYNAKQSAFVYLLCRNSGQRSEYFSAHDDDYFIRKSFKDLGLDDSIDERNLCSPMTNDCNIPDIASQLFNDIMNDYTNMKQVSVYGMTDEFSTDDDINKQLTTFSKAYFGRDICEPTGRYGSTCRTMRSYLKNVRNLLADVRIFKTKSIFDAVKPVVEINNKKNFDPNYSPVNVTASKAVQSCDTRDETYDIFLCGLYGDTALSMLSFMNLSYNELFYYRLFMGYYFMMLQKNPSILLKNTYNKEIDTLIKKSSNQYLRSKEAMSLTFRMLRDMYVAYPFHVGFLMYQEDLDRFSKQLAQIAPPIYTLYDKLRNVQKPE